MGEKGQKSFLSQVIIINSKHVSFPDECKATFSKTVI